MSMDTGGNSTKEMMCPYTLSDTYNDEDAIYGVNAANSMVKLGIYQVLFLKDKIINMDILNYWLCHKWFSNAPSSYLAVLNGFSRLVMTVEVDRVSQIRYSIHFVFYSICEAVPFKLALNDDEIHNANVLDLF